MKHSNEQVFLFIIQLNSIQNSTLNLKRLTKTFQPFSQCKSTYLLLIWIDSMLINVITFYWFAGDDASGWHDSEVSCSSPQIRLYHSIYFQWMKPTGFLFTPSFVSQLVFWTVCCYSSLFLYLHYFHWKWDSIVSSELQAKRYCFARFIFCLDLFLPLVFNFPCFVSVLENFGQIPQSTSQNMMGYFNQYQLQPIQAQSLSIV